MNQMEVHFSKKIKSSYDGESILNSVENQGK